MKRQIEQADGPLQRQSLEQELLLLRNDRQGLLDLIDKVAMSRFEDEERIHELEQLLFTQEQSERIHSRDLSSYKLLYDEAPFSYFLLDGRGMILKMNQVAQRQLADVCVNTPFRALLEQSFQREYRQLLLQTKQRPAGHILSLNVRSAEGACWTLRACRVDQGGAARIHLSVHDSADMLALRNSLTIANAVLDQMREGVMITEINGEIIRVNQTFSEITGYSAEEVLGSYPSLLASGRHGSEYYKSMWRNIQEHGWWSGEVWNRRKNGEHYPQWLNISRVYDAEASRFLYVAVFMDLSARKAQEARLNRIVQYDSLTGLPNRSLFQGLAQHALNRAQRNSQRLSLLFIDLDKFKDVNDEFGHHEGDLLLMQAAQRITTCLRESDSVARLGGDEFTVILEDITRVGVHRVAGKLLQVLADPFIFEGRHHRLGASIGIAHFPEHGQRIDDLLRRADAAMYQAKELGRNCWVEFKDEIERVNILRNESEKMLWKAISEERVEVFYQPVIDSHSLEIRSLEALVRLRTPEGAIVPPSEFVPTAENSGLIRPLGLRVFELACRFMHTLLVQGIQPPRVYVNLSARQMQDRDLVENLRQIARNHQLPMHHFGFEITESAAMENLQLALCLIDALKREGALISLDDFGTGYASLGRLGDLPLDVVKLDRSFITDMHLKEENRIIIRAVVELAALKGLSVTAEGIETPLQLQELRRLEVDHLQGYLFSYPLPEAEILALLAMPDRSLSIQDREEEGR